MMCFLLYFLIKSFVTSNPGGQAVWAISEMSSLPQILKSDKTKLKKVTATDRPVISLKVFHLLKTCLVNALA